MTDQPKRQFWQFHLSTALFGSLIAGLLMWANSREEQMVTKFSNGIEVNQLTRFSRGWPLPYMSKPAETTSYKSDSSQIPGSVYYLRSDTNPKLSIIYSEDRRQWLMERAYIRRNQYGDVAICCGILLSSCVLLEYAIRRRNVRREARRQ